ncbi:MAG: hypothetical protein AAF626_05755 [Pseudomonadota bacterium]
MEMLDLHPEIAALRAIAPIKTWSLLVTVLGDGPAGPDAPVSGADLRALFQPMGVKPEALRVALHRLAKDDWIRSTKTGRTSTYALTRKGLAETGRVRARVYRADVAGLSDWVCASFEQIAPAVTGPHVRLNASTLALPRAAVPDGALISRFEAAPAWFDSLCLSPEMWRALDALAVSARRLGAMAPPADARAARAIRLLVLHQWRRLALRDGLWLHKFIYPEGKAAACQAVVLPLLAHLERASGPS